MDDHTPESRIQLRVLGISYSKLKNQAYMLILSEVGGPLHLNMWIGEAEAHAIAVAIEGIRLPRPVTHDLFTSFIHGFGIKLTEVFINSVDDEIFNAELTFSDSAGRTIRIDSRTSDAIAIAMRTGAPIYTTRQILDEKGFVLEVKRMDEDGNELPSEPVPDDAGIDPADTARTGNITPRLENMTVEELQRTLDEAISAENYEEAARISEIIRRKKEG